MFNDNKQAVYIDQRFGWMDEFEFDLYFGEGEFQRIITGDHPGELEKKKQEIDAKDDKKKKPQSLQEIKQDNKKKEK